VAEGIRSVMGGERGDEKYLEIYFSINTRGHSYSP